MHRLLHNSILSNFFLIFMILLGGALASVQLRVKLSFGAELGAEYVAQPVELFLLMALCAAVSAVLLQIPSVTANNPMRLLAVAISAVLIAVALTVLLPDISLLQMVYFVVVSLGIGLIILTRLCTCVARKDEAE